MVADGRCLVALATNCHHRRQMRQVGGDAIDLICGLSSRDRHFKKWMEWNGMEWTEWTWNGASFITDTIHRY